MKRHYQDTPFQPGTLSWQSVLSLAVFCHSRVGREVPQAQSTVRLRLKQKTDPVLLPWKRAVPKAQSLLLTDMIQEILGTSKCRMSCNLVLESLGQPMINRFVDFSLFTLIVFAMGPVSYTQGFAVGFALPAALHRMYLASYPRLVLAKGIWLAC